MARYIEETEIYKLVEPHGTAKVHCSQIDELPRADVVPKSEVEKLNAEIETLKDNNEHLAVMLEEAKSEVGKLQNGLVIWKQNRFNLFQRLGCYEMARQKVASEIFAEIEKEIDTGISVIEKILNTKGGRANGKTVLISKYDVYIEAKKHLAELKKKYEVETK